MTFDNIVDAVMSRLNHTSTEAETRIGETVNRIYKRVTSAIGLNTSKRSTVSATATIGVSTLTFTGVEKLINVVDRSTTPYRVLREESIETLRMSEPSGLATPTAWAVHSVTANTVTILMNCVPDTGFVLYADGYVVMPTLSGSNEPSFPESYHEALYYGALADEYRKMTKSSLAKESEEQYEKILSDLKFFINKTSMNDFIQGKNKHRLPLTSGSGSGSGSGGGVSGSGTVGKYAKWTASTTIGDAILQEVANALFWQDSSNANNTNGLTINQLAADDHVLSLKSSDVATGLSTALSPNVETDDFSECHKTSATDGGLTIRSLMENTASSPNLQIVAVGGQATTTKSTSGRALIELITAQHNGANALSNVTADGNVVGVRARVGGSDVSVWLVDEDGDTWQNGGITALLGPHYLGDNANANNTGGLTINQSAADDHIVSLKSSDVATGLSSVTSAAVETDDFCSISKLTANEGGLRVQALNENAATTTALTLQSYGGQASTTKSTVGRSLVEIYASQHNGANALSNVTASGNVFSVRGRTSGTDATLMIVDIDGTIWSRAAFGILMGTYSALTNGAGAGAGTITNAPAAGNPTKWVPINDNGTIRYIPAW